MQPVTRAPLLISCALAAACAASAGAPAGPRREPGGVNPPAAANPTFAYYPVTGATAAELWISMRRSAPPDGFGRTLWNVTWTMRWEPMGGTCRITTANVTLQTEVRLPHWDPPEGASAELVAQWRSFIEALRVHENGHLEIAVQARREVESALRRLQEPSCAMMQGVGNHTGAQILTQLRARERAYDERTHHGATQGAVWPPRASAGGP